MAADGPVVRHYPVGMSVEALASAWVRQEQAPHGAVVVLDNEVSGRLRGGEPWTVGGDDGLMLAMVARPDLDPMKEALLWLPASMAAADSLTTATGREQGVLWPDRVVDRETGAPWCSINVVVQLGPGRVDHAVFSMRLDLRAGSETGGGGTRPGDGVDREVVIERYVSSARTHLLALQDDPAGLLSEYTDRCQQMDRRVRVELLPRGEARGRVAAIDADGFLVLESPTGMLERVAPASLRSIEVLPAGQDGPV